MKAFLGTQPSIKEIDELKAEGIWNNDWDASEEIIRRHKIKFNLKEKCPTHNEIIDVFSDFYFGGDPSGPPSQWKGFIKNEPLLVNKAFF